MPETYWLLICADIVMVPPLSPLETILIGGQPSPSRYLHAVRHLTGGGREEKVGKEGYEGGEEIDRRGREKRARDGRREDSEERREKNR
eukprot:752659-Hanusia_phi.AAC.2